MPKNGPKKSRVSLKGLNFAFVVFFEEGSEFQILYRSPCEWFEAL